MNLAQAIDLETLRLAPSGVKGAFAAAVRDLLGRRAAALLPLWMRPEARAADRLRLKPGSPKAEIVGAIEVAGRALTLPELRAALPRVALGGMKQALVDLQANGRLARHGECKHYRYGLPRLP